MGWPARCQRNPNRTVLQRDMMQPDGARLKRRVTPDSWLSDRSSPTSSPVRADLLAAKQNIRSPSITEAWLSSKYTVT
jgi:hypothetical protein